jgi:hypothetical protein
MRSLFWWIIDNFYNKNPFMRNIIMNVLFQDKNCWDGKTLTKTDGNVFSLLAMISE